MKKLSQLISHLPENVWLYRLSKLAFFVLSTSIILSVALTTLFFNPEVGCWAQSNILVLDVTCNGFVFAEIVGVFLEFLTNLWLLSLLVPILLVEFVADYLLFGLEPLNASTTLLGVQLLGYQVGLLILDVLAILYFLHFLTRIWKRLDSQKK